MPADAQGVADIFQRAPGAWAILLFSLAGIGISIYLTIVHYAGTPLVCTTNSVVNCQAVTTSAYSTVGGTSIPITVPGMAWFIVSGALAVAAILFASKRLALPEWLVPLHGLWSLFGLAFILYLIYVEAFQLHKICEWCTGVHILVILTFLVMIVRYRSFLMERYSAA